MKYVYFYLFKMETKTGKREMLRLIKQGIKI